ncbi:MAG: ribosomal RNA small subunit methyltransferase I [Patescibacteria group bacterium]
MATLYIVGTPIGNLEDITLRAIRVLKEVDLILCEDTRITKRLLARYKISTPTESFHARSEKSKVHKVIKLLEEGKNVALVTDAGTPTISDPGVLLVSQIKNRFSKGTPWTETNPRDALGNGGEVKIVPIPGPSAVITALSASGLPSDEFLFLGFLPHKKGRETLFKEIAETKRTVVFYESPHRIMKTLESLNKHIPDRKVVIARELTKMYEEFVSGAPTELLECFNKNKDKIRGEFVVIVGRKI